MLRYTKERIYMVEERLLVSTTVLRFLLILVASYLFGLLFYYVLYRDEKLHKKKRIDRKSTRLNSSHVSISYASTDTQPLYLHDSLPICEVKLNISYFIYATLY